MEVVRRVVEENRENCPKNMKLVEAEGEGHNLEGLIGKERNNDDDNNNSTVNAANDIIISDGTTSSNSSSSSKERSPLPTLLGLIEEVWQMKDSIEGFSHDERIVPPSNKNANGKGKTKNKEGKGKGCALM